MKLKLSPTEDATLEADGSQSIGVWNVSNVSWNATSNVGGEYGENADDGETFIIIDFTLKNTTNETQSYSSMLDQPQIILENGGLIDADTILSIQAGDQLIDGQIAPGLNRTGRYAFRVPSDQSENMQFQIQFTNGQRLVTEFAQ
ncbi:DUF4352 domain-containing protein [Deinococcus radiophilus]|uniref:DUF4352 domain-containing protein n=1 Tax=Deinococcus radiophilus TaxID=32062 RepID=A0A431W3B1_9DEIO|nr:DUF4352 domain-containing protein [Deinococcus radiophilus]RTR29918.1 DUF4352 domain-containing protein [Deinococcus radiophilus]UFA49727.1 DUF4352 domain-containing protein [Deinococcus radiophilus]